MCIPFSRLTVMSNHNVHNTSIFVSFSCVTFVTLTWLSFAVIRRPNNILFTSSSDEIFKNRLLSSHLRNSGRCFLCEVNANRWRQVRARTLFSISNVTILCKDIIFYDSVDLCWYVYFLRPFWSLPKSTFFSPIIYGFFFYYYYSTSSYSHISTRMMKLKKKTIF